MVATAAPLRNVDTSDAEEAGLIWGHLARQALVIAAAKLARALVPVYGVTWNRDAITSDDVGMEDNINRD